MILFQTHSMKWQPFDFFQIRISFRFLIHSFHVFLSICQPGELGYAETLFGRRRYLPELSSKNFNMRSFGERVARNMPIQGAAADIIKIAMIRVEARLREEGLRARGVAVPFSRVRSCFFQQTVSKSCFILKRRSFMPLSDRMLNLCMMGKG